MTLSTDAKEFMTMREADSSFAIRVVLSGPSIESTLRFIDKPLNRIGTFEDQPVYGYDAGGGIIYTYMKLALIPPTQDMETGQKFTIAFADIDGTLIPGVRQLAVPLSVYIDYVLITAPNVPEFIYPSLKARDFSGDEFGMVTAELRSKSLISEPIPAYGYDIENHPGVS